MSPLPLRRYRAERLLREEFGGRREEVLAVVRVRLRASGVQLDAGDLEGCYAQAWQGLYAALVAGREVANPAGWLTVVTFRRAIDEHRARTRAPVSAHADYGEQRQARAAERDLAAELDDRTRLRALFEGLRGRLSARECEAASLCYLQGLSRAQAAAQMGIGETAMRKLMEGRGAGRPGVAGKVGELLRMIRGGEWCEQQASLMRGLAFGILDPDGERYRLARAHQRECPACRAYILSLRGLAAVLPPLALPWGIGAGAGAAAGAGAGAGVGTGVGGAGAGAGAGAGVGTGASLGTGAGIGGAKLAVGCLLALGVSCAAVAGLPHRSDETGNSHPARRGALVSGASSASGGTGNAVAGAQPRGGVGGHARRSARANPLGGARRASPGRSRGPRRVRNRLSASLASNAGVRRQARQRAGRGRTNATARRPPPPLGAGAPRREL
jgi:DNA-directed RNA polymerase specialized sigma24 family protein